MGQVGSTRVAQAYLGHRQRGVKRMTGESKH